MPGLLCFPCPIVDEHLDSPSLCGKFQSGILGADQRAGQTRRLLWQHDNNRRPPNAVSLDHSLTQDDVADLQIGDGSSLQID